MEDKVLHRAPKRYGGYAFGYFLIKDGVSYIYSDEEGFVEVLNSFDKYSEMNDIDGRQIFENDQIYATSTSGNSYFGTVKFKDGCFVLWIKKVKVEKTPEYDVGQYVPLFNFESLKLF